MDLTQPAPYLLQLPRSTESGLVDIRFPIHLWQQWDYFVQESPGECCAMARLHPDWRIGHFQLEELYWIRQRSSSAYTEFDDEAFDQFFQEHGDQREDIRVWLHSHVNMGTFWSGTDTDNIQRLSRTWGFLISIVTNKRREYKARVDVAHPLPQSSLGTVIVPIEAPPMDLAAMRATFSEITQPYTGLFSESEGGGRSSSGGFRYQRGNTFDAAEEAEGATTQESLFRDPDAGARAMGFGSRREPGPHSVMAESVTVQTDEDIAQEFETMMDEIRRGVPHPSVFANYVQGTEKSLEIEMTANLISPYTAANYVERLQRVWEETIENDVLGYKTMLKMLENLAFRIHTDHPTSVGMGS